MSFGKLKDAYKYNVQILIKLQNLKSYNIGVKSDRAKKHFETLIKYSNNEIVSTNINLRYIHY